MISLYTKLHFPKIRDISDAHPHGFGWIGMDFKDSASLALDETSTCGKDPLFIEIDLWQRNVTIVEDNPLFPLAKNPWKLSIVFRISHLDFHRLHLLSGPELPPPGPLIGCGTLAFLEKVEKDQKIVLFATGIEARPKGILEPEERSIFPFDPEDH